MEYLAYLYVKIGNNFLLQNAQFLGACPEVMVTYIVIVYRNYIIPKLGE